MPRAAGGADWLPLRGVARAGLLLPAAAACFGRWCPAAVADPGAGGAVVDTNVVGGAAAAPAVAYPSPAVTARTEWPVVSDRVGDRIGAATAAAGVPLARAAALTERCAVDPVGDRSGLAASGTRFVSRRIRPPERGSRSRIRDVLSPDRRLSAALPRRAAPPLRGLVPPGAPPPPRPSPRSA